MQIESFGATEQGPRHGGNEDTILADGDLGLYVVTDGLGGQPAGEIASRLAVDVVSSFLSRSRNPEITWPFGIEPDRSLSANRLLTAVKLANRRVWKHADDHEDHYGMGTTIAAILVDDDVATVCSAGDTRLYLVRDKRIEQMTEDDSWARFAREEGLLSDERILTHPMRNMIISALGAAETIEPSLREHDLLDNDVLVLCSDGLYRLVPDEAILNCVVSVNGEVEESASQLMNRAKDGDVTDDMSAIVVRCRAETS